ncbi:MAG: hypothetical protein ACREFB_15000, partial [Stellaceae bacterium]
PHHDAVWNRGACLVVTVGRCSDCRTPRGVLGRPEEGRFLGGGISRVSGDMADIVHNMRRLTGADRAAIAVYLKSVPAVSSPAKK